MIARRMPWREAALVAVDVETTGLDPQTDQVISFAAVARTVSCSPAVSRSMATVVPVSVTWAGVVRSSRGVRPGRVARRRGERVEALGVRASHFQR